MQIFYINIFMHIKLMEISYTEINILAITHYLLQTYYR